MSILFIENLYKYELLNIKQMTTQRSLHVLHYLFLSLINYIYRKAI